MITEQTIPQSPPERPRRGMDIPVQAWVRLMRVYHKMNRKSTEEMKQWGLSVSRFDVLNQAGIREGRSQQEIADALLVTKGNIVQLLDRMEAEGLLYRRRKGRTNHIFLTDKGRDLREQSLTGHEARIANDFSVLTGEEQQTLLALLRTLDRSLDSTNS